MLNNPNTLFVNSLTTVDCAFLCITDVCRVEGLSFNVSVELQGYLDPKESVIVDFSALKKALKAGIDDIDSGYDHKLIVPEGLEDGLRSKLVAHSIERDGRYILVNVPSNKPVLSVPTNAIRKASKDSKLSEILKTVKVTELRKGLGLEKLLQAFQDELKVHLQGVVDKLYEKSGIEICRVVCDTNMLVPSTGSQYSETSTFSYTHGLRHSTSLGCQNIVHGHLSFIQFVYDDANDADNVKNLSQHVSDILQGTHFSWIENADSAHDYGISYESDARGKFSIPNSNELFNKVRMSTNETTVENLAHFVFTSFVEPHLQGVPSLKRIYVSEGLSKGSYVDVSSRVK